MTGQPDMGRQLEMKVERADDGLRLIAPGVGLFTRAMQSGEVLVGGQAAGVLMALGRALTLVVPPGVSGVITSARPERVHEPVGMNTVLYELADVAALGDPANDGPVRSADIRTADGSLVLVSPQTGRFYHRSAPDDPPFVAADKVIEAGATVGMIEVMKTFSHVHYDVSGGLPERARIVRLIAADGSEVREGDPLLEVEPA